MIVFHPVFAQAETEAAEALSGTAQRVTVTQRIRNPQTTTQTQKKNCNILHAEDQYYDDEQKKCLVEPGGCELGYKANEKFTMCVVNEGGICYPQDPDKPDPNAPQIGGYEFNAQAKCVLVKCNDGYKPENNKCIVDAETESQVLCEKKEGGTWNETTATCDCPEEEESWNSELQICRVEEEQSDDDLTKQLESAINELTTEFQAKVAQLQQKEGV